MCGSSPTPAASIPPAWPPLCGRWPSGWGSTVRVAHVEGDDLLARAAELGFGSPLAANAYLGAWGIADCLNDGADVVVTGRVTDASVIVGPAAAHFGWGRTDYDALAGAVAAGHVIECGIQASGGNYSFFNEVADLTYAGFPLAEIHADGSSVITKHPGTGGLGQRRHRDRAAALRDHRRALRQPRCDAARRLHPAA